VARLGSVFISSLELNQVKFTLRDLSGLATTGLYHRLAKKFAIDGMALPLDPLNPDLRNVSEIGILSEDYEPVTHPGSSDPHIHNVWTPP